MPALKLHLESFLVLSNRARNGCSTAHKMSWSSHCNTQGQQATCSVVVRC